MSMYNARVGAGDLSYDYMYTCFITPPLSLSLHQLYSLWAALFSVRPSSGLICPTRNSVTAFRLGIPCPESTVTSRIEGPSRRRQFEKTQPWQRCLDIRAQLECEVKMLVRALVKRETYTGISCSGEHATFPVGRIRSPRVKATW